MTSRPNPADPLASVFAKINRETRAYAKQCGVDYASVRGTGIAGRVTKGDIDRAAGVVSASSSPAAAGASADDDSIFKSLYGDTTPPTVLPPKVGERRSRFANGVNVRDDVFADNPLLADLKQSQPGVYRQAMSEGPPPELFESGPRPPFLASGVDPGLLRHVGWEARHALAAETDRGRALAMYEKYSGEGAFLAGIEQGHHAGNAEYESRFMRWAGGFPKQPPPDSDD